MTSTFHSQEPADSERDRAHLAGLLRTTNMVYLLGQPGTGMQAEAREVMEAQFGAGLVLDAHDLVARGADALRDAFSSEKPGNPWRLVGGLEGLAPGQLKDVLDLCGKLSRDGSRVVAAYHGNPNDLNCRGPESCMVLFWNSKPPGIELSSALAARRAGATQPALGSASPKP